MWQFFSRALLTVAAALFISVPAMADQSKDVGEYVIHYNALTTDTLQADVARRYGLRRSPNRVLLNISVLRKVMGTTGQPVHARVTAHAKNLNNQLQRVHMREVGDRGAIYYLGDITVNNGDNITFEINVSPDVRGPAYTISFQQQFFTS